VSAHYVAVVWLHVLAALVWLGGMIAFALLAPVLRRIQDEAVRQGLFDQLGRRFRVVGWICIAILLATGVEELRLRGWWGPDFWSVRFLESSLGRRLALKLGIVGAMLALQALHDFWFGPRAALAPAGSREALALRRRAALLARVNAVLGVWLVWAAVRLGR
jgi:putative copper export protein